MMTTKPHPATAGKVDFPLDTVELADAIDDEALHEPVLACHRVGLGDSYQGGADSDALLRVATAIVAELRAPHPR